MDELHVYDFDGTLFNSPTDTPENHKRYEELTGIPWTIDKKTSEELSNKTGKTIHPRSGWWGRPETLEPPLVPIPAPVDWFNKAVVSALNESKANESAIVLLLTGRHSKLRNHVERICNEASLLDEKITLYCMGESGPNPKGDKPNKTLPWKLWIIGQYIDSNPSITKTIFWEDREDHIEQMKKLSGILCHSVLVNRIVS